VEADKNTQVSQSLGPDLTPRPPEYDSRVLNTQSRRSMINVNEIQSQII
jgi:hypothetical protein